MRGEDQNNEARVKGRVGYGNSSELDDRKEELIVETFFPSPPISLVSYNSSLSLAFPTLLDGFLGHLNWSGALTLLVTLSCLCPHSCNHGQSQNFELEKWFYC